MTNEEQELNEDASPSPKKKATSKPIKRTKVKKKKKNIGPHNIKPLTSGSSNYPRHSIEKALRIPNAILEQNAGKETTEQEAAAFLGLTSSKGPFKLEIRSATKYGFLERLSPAKFG